MTTKTRVKALDELKQFNTWVAYDKRPGKRPGKLDKIPINPATGKAAATDDFKTWGSYDQALKANKDGVGFVFTLASGIVGIDLDSCIDEAGELATWADQIVKALDSYTELSPSGRGLHIFVKGQLPPEGRRKGKVEMYDSGRFFTWTGEHYAGTPQTIEERQAQLLDVHRLVFGKKEERPAPAPKAPVDLADTELIDKAKSAANGDNFTRLWNGDTNLHNRDHSAADQALCNHLAFYTGNDPVRIDQLFRQSGLFRDKWDKRHSSDGRTYGQMTIDKAIAATTDVYSPIIPPSNGHNQVSNELSNQTLDNTPQPEKEWIFNPLTVSQLIKKPPKEWLIDGLLGERDIAMIYGESESGKTFVALDLAFEAALGGMFAQKFKVLRPLRVVYCTGEGQSGLPNRFLAAGNSRHIWQTEAADLIEQNLIIFEEVPQLYDGDIPQGIYNFVGEWQQRQLGPVDLLFIDTLHSASYGADENHAKDAGLITQAVKYTRNTLGCTVNLVHHTNRSGKYRGSSAFHGAMDTMLEVKKIGGDEANIRSIECFKLKDEGKFRPLFFKLMVDEASKSVYPSWLDREVIALNEGKPIKRELIKDEIKALLKQKPGLNQTQIVEAIQAASRQTILTALEEMETEGAVIAASGDRGAKVYQLSMDLDLSND